MTIRFACPRCKAVLEAPDKKIGEKINCPKCQQRLQVPGPPPNKTVLGAWQDVPPPVRRTTTAPPPPPPPPPSPEKTPSTVQASPRPHIPVEEEEVETPSPREKGPREKFCHECGAVIRSRAEICPECGVRQPGQDRVVVEKFDGEPQEEGRVHRVRIELPEGIQEYVDARLATWRWVQQWYVWLVLGGIVLATVAGIVAVLIGPH